MTLKPCPFCGAEGDHLDYQFVYGQGNKAGRVECDCCGVCGPEVRTDYKPVEHWADDAAKIWNERAPILTRKVEIP